MGAGESRVRVKPLPISETERLAVAFYLRHFLPPEVVQAHSEYSFLCLGDDMETPSRMYSGSRAEGMFVPEYHNKDGQDIVADIDVMNNIGFTGGEELDQHISQLPDAVVLLHQSLRNQPLILRHTEDIGKRDYGVIIPAKGTPPNYVYIHSPTTGQGEVSKLFVKREGKLFLSSSKLLEEVNRKGARSFLDGSTLIRCFDDMSDYSSDSDIDDAFGHPATRGAYFEGTDTHGPTVVAEGAMVTLFKRSLAFMSQDLHIETEFCVGYPLSKWPHIAHNFITRPRPNGWPTNKMLTTIEEKELCVFVVPTSSKTGKYKDMQWRYSFTPAETLLAHSLTKFHKTLYVHLKLLRHFFFRIPKDKPTLPTYCLKTILFWQVEQLPQGVWRESNSVHLLYHLVNVLYESVKRAIIPHFFIPEANLLFQASKLDLMNLSDKIKMVLDDLTGAVLHISDEIDYFHSLGGIRRDMHGLIQFHLNMPLEDLDPMQPLLSLLTQYCGILETVIEERDKLAETSASLIQLPPSLEQTTYRLQDCGEPDDEDEPEEEEDGENLEEHKHQQQQGNRDFVLPDQEVHDDQDIDNSIQRQTNSENSEHSDDSVTQTIDDKSNLEEHKEIKEGELKSRLKESDDETTKTASLDIDNGNTVCDSGGVLASTRSHGSDHENTDGKVDDHEEQKCDHSPHDEAEDLKYKNLFDKSSDGEDDSQKQDGAEKESDYDGDREDYCELDDDDDMEEREIHKYLCLFQKQFSVNNITTVMIDIINAMQDQEQEKSTKWGSRSFGQFVSHVLLDTLALSPQITHFILLYSYVSQMYPLALSSWHSWLNNALEYDGSHPKAGEIKNISAELIKSDTDLNWVAGFTCCLQGVCFQREIQKAQEENEDTGSSGYDAQQGTNEQLSHDGNKEKNTNAKASSPVSSSYGSSDSLNHNEAQPYPFYGELVWKGGPMRPSDQLEGTKEHPRYYMAWEELLEQYSKYKWMCMPAVANRALCLMLVYYGPKA